MTADEYRAVAKPICKQAANPSTPAEMHYYLLDLAQMYETMHEATEKDRCKPSAALVLSARQDHGPAGTSIFLQGALGQGQSKS